jgi:hypothetical protein
MGNDMATQKPNILIIWETTSVPAPRQRPASFAVGDVMDKLQRHKEALESASGVNIDSSSASTSKVQGFARPGLLDFLGLSGRCGAAEAGMDVTDDAGKTESIADARRVRRVAV